MNKYDELDAAILVQIDAGNGKFTSLCASVDDKARQHINANTEKWRVVDRRLQAMRKSGKIKYLRTGWVVA